MIIINGQNDEDAAGMTISSYLDSKGYNKKCIAVELNESIVKKCNYDSTIIKENDSIEIVSFVGGG